MTTDDTTARLAAIAEISDRIEYGEVSGSQIVWLVRELRNALERERVLIENQARLCEALKVPVEGIGTLWTEDPFRWMRWQERTKKLLSEIGGGE